VVSRDSLHEPLHDEHYWAGQSTESAFRDPPRAIGDPNGVGDDERGSGPVTVGEGQGLGIVDLPVI
jgi:hypothetical protein